jgi:hypothetical protein
MDNVSWELFQTVIHLMHQFARFRHQPPVQPQIVNVFFLMEYQTIILPLVKSIGQGWIFNIQDSFNTKE